MSGYAIAPNGGWRAVDSEADCAADETFSTEQPPMSPVDYAAEIRYKRDLLLNAVQWRFDRYASQTRLGLTPTDDIAKLDAYAEALRNVPEQSGFPDESKINWPTLD